MEDFFTNLDGQLEHKAVQNDNQLKVDRPSSSPSKDLFTQIHDDIVSYVQDWMHLINFSDDISISMMQETDTFKVTLSEETCPSNIKFKSVLYRVLSENTKEFQPAKRIYQDDRICIEEFIPTKEQEFIPKFDDLVPFGFDELPESKIFSSDDKDTSIKSNHDDVLYDELNPSCFHQDQEDR